MSGKETSAVHGEHRRRMKQKFLENGLDVMHDHEVLELLLYYAIPRMDVNPVAHRLLERFGSLHAVFEAPAEELLRIDGIGENAATLLHLAMELFRRYDIDSRHHALESTRMSTTEMLGTYLAPYFRGLTHEVARIACLDNRGIVICCEEIASGTVGEVALSPRKVVEIALRRNAVGVALAHNHPHGLALPSREDIGLTKQIKQALQTVGVQLLEHVIVAGEEFVSMADSGMLG